MDDFAPRYRIQAVSDLTGVATATLRAWERRYGFPSPHRTSAAYRLYSDRDVTLIRRMRGLVESGIAPNDAARQLLQDDLRVQAEPVLADPFATSVERIVSAAERMDGAGLQLELKRASMLDSGLTTFERVLRPALIAIGEKWHAGELSIAAEHLASHLIAATLLDLLRLTAVPTDARSILMACFADEQHSIPLYGSALRFASWGYRPILLGVRTPPSAIARGVEALAPDAVGLSVTIAPQPASAARELVDAYADACRDTPWFVGGQGAAALAPLIVARKGMVIPDAADQAKKALDRLFTPERRKPKDRR